MSSAWSHIKSLSIEIDGHKISMARLFSMLALTQLFNFQIIIVVTVRYGLAGIPKF